MRPGLLAVVNQTRDLRKEAVSEVEKRPKVVLVVFAVVRGGGSVREDVRRDFWGERTFSFYEDAAQLKFKLTNQLFSINRGRKRDFSTPSYGRIRPAHDMHSSVVEGK